MCKGKQDAFVEKQETPEYLAALKGEEEDFKTSQSPEVTVTLRDNLILARLRI